MRYSGQKERMPCLAVLAVQKVGKFGGEVALHFRRPENLDKPTVLVFPEVLICSDCGLAHFAVPERQLRQLAKGAAAAG